MSEAPPPMRNFYGRRHGKTLKDNQRLWLSQDLSALSPGLVAPHVNPARKPLDLSWTQERPLWIEVGFGGGEHLVHQALTNPDIAFIGCEPYINGVAMTLGKWRKTQGKNLRLYPGDIRDLFEVLPTNSVEKAFVLYPDPWPKTRHHRRRFVTAEYLNPLAQVMTPGGELRIASDIFDYIRQSLIEVPRAGFEWRATRADDWRRPWSDWISTRYEQKALHAGRMPTYLTFFNAKNA